MYKHQEQKKGGKENKMRNPSLGKKPVKESRAKKGTKKKEIPISKKT